MALKLLIAAPENDYFSQMASAFTESGYEVYIANTGIDAQIQLGQNKFFHIIMAYELKQHSSLTVMKFIKFNAPNTRFSMTISSEAINTLEAEKQDITQFKNKLTTLGAFRVFTGYTEINDFVSFIDSQQDFNDLVANLKETPKEERTDGPINSEDSEFVEIPIDHFFSTAKNIFDVFIKIGSGKYIKILHKGDQFDQTEVKKYKEEKKVGFLFFKKEDHKKYIRLLAEINRKVIQSPQSPAQIKYNLTKHVTSEVIKSAWVEGVNHGLIDQASEICENIYQFVQKQNSLFSLLRQLQDIGPEEYDHSFLVAFFSCSLAKQFDWNSTVTTQSLTMASMFHDIGLIKIDEKIRTKNKKEMTPEELKLYQLHPQYSLELLENNQSISRTILQIIHQHHECIDGSGYPYNLSNNKILMLSQVLIFVNEFADIMIENNLRPVDALKKILVSPDAFKRHNSLIIEKFSHIFIDPEILGKKKAS